MRVDESWQASVCMSVSFLKSRAPIKQEQELHGSWWELMRVGKQVFAWAFSAQLSCTGQTRTRVVRHLMRIDWLLPRETSHQLASKSEAAQSWWELQLSALLTKVRHFKYNLVLQKVDLYTVNIRTLLDIIELEYEKHACLQIVSI